MSRKDFVSVETFIHEPDSRAQCAALEDNVKEFGITYFGMKDRRQGTLKCTCPITNSDLTQKKGIVHVIGPEQGFTVRLSHQRMNVVLIFFSCPVLHVSVAIPILQVSRRTVRFPDHLIDFETTSSWCIWIPRIRNWYIRSRTCPGYPNSLAEERQEHADYRRRRTS